MYYRDVAFWGDMRLQKKGDTSPNLLGRLFETIPGYFPNPAILPYNFRTTTLRGVPTLQVTIKCVM